MFQEKIPLSRYSNYKIGGPARYFFESDKADDLIAAVGKARRMKTSVFILGGGTNILFSDDGFPGLIIKPNNRFIKNDCDDFCLRIGAATPIEELLDYSIAKGLSGLEWAGGLPGNLGGAIYGNAGCFGGEIKDNVKEVISLDISGPKPKIVKRINSECGFGYRSSIFKKNKNQEIILEVALLFKKGDKKAIQSDVEEKVNYRKERQPLEYPNIGSIFKNVPLTRINADNTLRQGSGQARINANIKNAIKTDPFPVIPTARLISEAGLKGISYGGAIISPKHPNFIVNALNASAQDVKKLIELAKNKVKEKFLIDLEEEIVQL